MAQKYLDYFIDEIYRLTNARVPGGLTMTSDTIVNLNPLKVVATSASAGSLSMRSYLSTHHLWSAHHLTTLAMKIENEHVGRSKFDWNHRAYTIAAITCSVAFLEAAINEIYQDAADESQRLMNSLGEANVERLKLVWELTEQRTKYVSILEKYQLALHYLNLERFDTGKVLFENVALVIALRNVLIHFKPETSSGRELSKFEVKMAQKLRGKYPTCKLFKGAGNPFFPDHCLGYGCCAWAIDSTQRFADEFFLRIKYEPNYQIALPGILAQLG